MLRYLFFACYIAAFAEMMPAQAPSAMAPADWTTVSGRVTDFRGKPVAGARISAFPMDAALSGGMPRQPITDADGKYRYVLPAYPGKTRLCAIKEDEGYPDTQGLLFVSPEENMPTISLAAGAKIENVDIHLGPPDGVLEGQVFDAATGTKLSKARVTLHRDAPESTYSTSLGPDAHFLFALPAAPVDVNVTAPGYKQWAYKDPLTGKEGIFIGSDDHKSIVIELVPK